MPANEQKSERRKTITPIAAAVLITAAMILTTLFVFGIRYETNDDATLANIAAGAYGSDVLHMVYVNFIYAALLRPLYWIFPAANWYVISQLVLVGVCFICIGLLLIKQLGTIKGGCVFLTASLPFCINLIYSFQYVKNSGVCLAVGLLLIWHGLGKRNFCTAAGLLLAVIGSLIRFNNFMAVGALAGCILLQKFLSLPKPQKKAAVITMAVLFACVFSLKALDTAFYVTDDGWNHYRQYNAARTELSDYKAQGLNSEQNVLADAGFSDNDTAMLARWDFYDEAVFPTARVQKAADALPRVSIWDAVKDAAKAGLHMLYGKPYRYLFALALLFGLVFLRWDKHCWSFWGTLGVLGLLLVYLMTLARYPARVEVTLLFSFCLFAAAALAQGTLRAPRVNLPTALGSTVIILCLCIPHWVDLHTDSINYKAWQYLEEDYFSDMAAHKENLYLISTETINVAAGTDVWHPREKNFFSNIVAYGGWLSHAPHREKALQSYGVSRPLIDSIDNPRVFLSYHGIDKAVLYATEHSGQEVTVTDNGANALCRYQLHSA